MPYSKRSALKHKAHEYFEGHEGGITEQEIETWYMSFGDKQ